MRRLVWILAFSGAGLMAQEHAAPAAGEAHGQAGEHEASGPKEVSIWWKWANFALLAGGLGYLIAKNAPAYFASRNEEIRKGLEEGAELQREANARTAAMEARLKNLATEIAEMKATSKADIAAEGERIQSETQAAMEKIQAHAESEIAAAAKNERARLKTYTADLALRLAEDKLRGQMTSQTDSGLVDSFLKGLN